MTVSAWPVPAPAVISEVWTESGPGLPSFMENEAMEIET